MKPYEDKVYVGAVPDTKIEELFDPDKLTDERINEELKDNTASKDYIFCPTCEANLSKYLEAPYAEYLSKGKNLNSDISYFFWVSIIWRMSISKQFEFALPAEIEQSLGECLSEYIDAVTQREDPTTIIEKCNLSYRLLCCPTYPLDKLACLGGRYWKKEGILTLTLGNTILCAKFENSELPDDFLYLGLEEIIKSSFVNNGIIKEVYSEVDNKVFENAMIRMGQEIAVKRLCSEIAIADAFWQEVGLEGSMPKEIFITIAEKLYSDDSKQGDRKIPERYIQIFNETLEAFGYKGIDRS